VTDTTDDGGSLWWTLLTILCVIVLGVVLLRFFFRLIALLVPLAVLAGVGYVIYRLLTRDSEASAYIGSSDPLLLETDDDDPLERRFRELEAEEAQVDAELERLEQPRE
jgi:hypothetical protein